MARYDVVVIGAGLGGLTTGAILARAGRKVLVIERSNSVGGAASSYMSAICSSKARCTRPAIRAIPAIRTPRADASGRHRRREMDSVRHVLRSGRRSARSAVHDAGRFRRARRALTERFPRPVPGCDQLLGEMERMPRRWARLARPERFPEVRAKVSRPSRNWFRRSATASVAVAEARSGVRRRRGRQMRAGGQSRLIITTTRQRCGGSLCDGAGRLSPKRRPFRAGRLATAAPARSPAPIKAAGGRGVGAPRRQRDCS